MPNVGIHIHGANLRHDLESKTHSIHGGFPTVLQQAFRPYNFEFSHAGTTDFRPFMGSGNWKFEIEL